MTWGRIAIYPDLLVIKSEFREPTDQAHTKVPASDSSFKDENSGDASFSEVMDA